MDKRFHLFVRTHAVGVSVAPITLPYLGTFAADLPSARADLAHVLTKLIERGEHRDEPGFFDDARLRRVELPIRALQRGRLLEVPMRFSVLSYGTGSVVRAAAGTRRARARGPMKVLVPRLGLSGELDDAADLIPFAEELIRHELAFAPLERLLAVAWTGDESLDTLTVTARVREALVPRKKDDDKKKRAGLPPGLAEACRRLGDEVAAGTLERAFQRDAELARLAEILNARTRASVLIIGPASVGKTCLVHELAQRAADPGSSLAGLEIYSSSGGRIVAGMRYLGEWQARVERMLTELRGRRAVLHLESLSELLSVGAGGDTVDVARHLLPAIEAGQVCVIVEATADDVGRAERTHAALVQAMRPLVLAPLEPGAARLALAQASARVGRSRRVRFDDAALERALDLTERFGDGVLPGGAVELLRGAAAGAGTGTPGASAGSERVPSVGAEAITRAFGARTGYPRELVDPTVRLDPAAVLAHFRGRVVGQDEATALLAQLVVTLKTNLADPARPLGSFLLLGPTGVGKTESALALAAYLFGDPTRLARFDMAEYAAPGSAQRLVAHGGAESSLARRVREQPFGVVLLDEIEKADGGVHDLLLQILGEGRLADAAGRTVSFRNTIVLLTSNLGADGAGRSLGFGAGGASGHEAHYRAAAAAFFRPELLNRFDQIVPYRPLGAEVIAQLARRALEKAVEREGLARRGVVVTWDEAVVTRLAELGFDPRLGARPLKRAVEEHVVAPLARLLAARSAKPPARVRLVVRSGAVAVEAE